MSGPGERRRVVDLYSATPMATARVVERLGYSTGQCPERRPAKDPGYAGHMARPIVPPKTGAEAIEPVPGGMRRKRAAERLGAGVGAVNHRVKAYRGGGMAALRPGNGNAGQTAGRRCGGIGTPATRRPRAAGSRGRSRGNAVMREVVEVAGKDPGAGLRRLSDRDGTLPTGRPRPACSPGSMTCLPGIAPGGRLLPPRRARG